MASDALGSELISRVVGYKLQGANFSDTTPNLPQRIALLGEANTANQATYPTEPTLITSSQQAGELFGYGSPIHISARILQPVFSDGVGGIPVVVYAQEEDETAVAKVIELTVTGTVSEAATHTVVLCGRRGIDGESYDFNVAVGDSVTEIASAIADTINANLYAPVIATSALGVVTLTAKWAGLTSDDINVRVDKNDKDAGMTYAAAEDTAGSFTPSITSALTSFGNEWNTLVVNTYGAVPATMTELETINGKPSTEGGTGRYASQVMKPFIALTGSTADEDTTATDARKDEVTIAICPAPLSEGLPMEAAANMATLFARIGQDTPHLDVSGRSYPDMPTPTSIGTMATYSNRDSYVKQGNSTVDLVNGVYKIMDFVTTYHPVGEAVPQFRYCRNLNLDFNVKFGYALLEETYVIDKVIAGDGDVIEVDGVIKPKIWKGIIADYADDLESRALITDSSFMVDSTVVNLSSSNPDRLETFFRYKRTGIARVLPTTAEAGFNFG